jgi:apolipoprotein N-acyltransferase
VKARVFAPAIASGALLWAAFFPLNLGPLAFVALVPWLALVRAPVSNRRRYLAAYLGGVTFFALATNWVRVAHPMMYLSWLGLAVVMPVFWLVALALLRALDARKVPLAVAVPVAWVALEYCRMHFPTGFAFLKPLGAYQMIGFGWYFLGYTQHEFVTLIQIADLGGVYAVSFVVGAMNGALADVALRTARVRRALGWEEEPNPPAPFPKREGGEEEDSTLSPPSLLGKGAGGLGSSGLGLAFALALLVAGYAYGAARLKHEPFAAGPMVAAIQGNVSQGEKMSRGGGLREQYARAFGLAYRHNPQPDLIVWPETCYWEDWAELAPGASTAGMTDAQSAALEEADKQFRRRWDVPILFGISGHTWDGARYTKGNTALLVGPHLRAPVRYDKMHLVPFGEYVPLGDRLPFMQWFTPYEKGYECTPGEAWTRFPLTTKDGRAFTFGCLICYEDSDPYLARQYVARDPVHFLVNTSNDGWFDGTEEHEQHLAICRFRAVEARRAVVRAVNMGVSAVIDSDGRVVALPRPIHVEGRRVTLGDYPLERWGAAKKVEGVVLVAVPLDDRESPYARFGDWLPALCWAAALAALVARWLARGERGA